MTMAGGYSAYMILPGREAPGQGSMAMLDGGNWCSRKLDSFDENHRMEVNIDSIYTAILVSKHATLLSHWLETRLIHPSHFFSV